MIEFLIEAKAIRRAKGALRFSDDDRPTDLLTVFVNDVTSIFAMYGNMTPFARGYFKRNLVVSQQKGAWRLRHQNLLVFSPFYHKKIAYA